MIFYYLSRIEMSSIVKNENINFRKNCRITLLKSLAHMSMVKIGVTKKDETLTKEVSVQAI